MKKYFTLVLILVIGTVLRFYHNTDISLWHDEAFSALLIKYPFGEMMYRIGLDVHPPMYYIFLRFWHYLFGDSLLALRSYTVFFSVGTIWAAWAFVKEAFKNEKAATLAALLVAVNPFQIQYATEARMYTMGAFFALLAAYFLTRALHSQSLAHENADKNMPHTPEDIKNTKWMFLNYLGFSLSIIIMIYTHYYLLFTAAAICFYGLVYLFMHHQGNIKKYFYLLGSFALIFVSYLPWLKTFLYQYRQVGEGYWIPKMDVWSIPSTLYTLLVGFGHDVSQKNVQQLILGTTLLVVFILIRFIYKTQSFHKWLVILGILAPFLGSILFLILAKLKGSNSSVYLVRYFLYTSAFFSIAIAVWLKEIKLKWFGWLLGVCYIILNCVAFVDYWKDLNIKNKPGMNAAAKYLQANVEPNHKVFVGTSFEFFNYKYYNNTTYPLAASVRPLLFTGGERFAKNISHFAGSAILTDQDLVPDFNEAVSMGQTVWVIWTHAFGSNIPKVPNNWKEVSHQEYPDVRPYVGTSIHVSQFKVQ